MRSCYSRSSSLFTAPAARALHSSPLTSGSTQYVSQQPRPVPRLRHFDPPQPTPVQKVDPLPLRKERRAHEKVSPRQTPAEGTHTLKAQRNDIRLQFQLEPATRTKVQHEGVNAKILDYTRAEVYSTAPWPCYREIILNRPKSMHALNPALIQQIGNLLIALEHNKDITAALMIGRHAGSNTVVQSAGGQKRTYEKSFSTGMDLPALLALVKETREAKIRAKRLGGRQPSSLQEASDALPGSAPLAKYFRSLYTLSFNLSKVRTPLVLVLDGLTIGAGAGMALQARYRVATENTVVSYPQASLGWFPDAGASYTLSHLDGHMGLFLALTGWQVKSYDAVRLNLATHYCESDELHRFGKRIGESSLTYQFAEDTIEQAFGMFSEGPCHLPLPPHSIHDMITDVFGRDSVEEMIQRLQEIAEPQINQAKVNKGKAAFAREILKRMLASSPLSLKATHRLLQHAQFLPLEKCLTLEYRLAQRLLCRLNNPLEADLFSAPNWQKKTLADVTEQDLEALFEEDVDPDRELNLDYPEKKKSTWYI